MHGNSDLVDTADFSAFFAQARKYFRPSEGMFAKAKMTLALWTNFAQAKRFSLKREGFSLKLEIFAQAKS